MTASPPSIENIHEARESLKTRIIRTPIVSLSHDRFAGLLDGTQSTSIKLELFQHAGSFKARGNLLGIDQLAADRRAAGVIAASGGNHALAVSWAAHSQHVPATIIMPKSTDPVRIDGCKTLGARVILVDDIAGAFDEMHRLAAENGSIIMHPFEGSHMTLGGATCGAEIIEDLPDLDVMIVAVGGGGLIGGIASAIRQIRPQCAVIGVEPFGADSLSQSFQQGKPVRIDRVDTIADSLGSPTALPYSYAIAREFVSQIVRITDAQMIEAMGLMRDTLKIMAEPACGAALAAAIGPLRETIADKKVCILACGSNIGMERYRQLLV